MALTAPAPARPFRMVLPGMVLLFGGVIALMMLTNHQQTSTGTRVPATHETPVWVLWLVALGVVGAIGAWTGMIKSLAAIANRHRLMATIVVLLLTIGGTIYTKATAAIASMPSMMAAPTPVAASWANAELNGVSIDERGSIKLARQLGQWSTTQHTAIADARWTSVGATSNGDVWFASESTTGRLKNGQWQRFALTGRLNAMDGRRSDAVWGVGERGLIAFFNGKTWTTIKSPTDESLHAVKVISDTSVYAVGDNGVVLHYQGKAFMQIASEPVLGSISFWAIGASDETNIYAAGGDIRTSMPKVVHCDGHAWSNVPDFTTYNGNVFDVVVTPRYLYVLSLIIGSPDVRRYDGMTWENLNLPAAAQGIIDADLAGDEDGIWVTQAYAGAPTYDYWDNTRWHRVVRPMGPVPCDIVSHGGKYWVATATSVVDSYVPSDKLENEGTITLTYQRQDGWRRAKLNAEVPPGTKVTAAYSDDRNTWKSQLDQVPKSTPGGKLFVKVTLTTSNTSTPSVRPVRMVSRP